METFARTDDGQTVWHLCWQAAKGRDLLVDPSLLGRIRGRLLSAHEPRGRDLLHYLLMPSEIHVLCSLPEGLSPELIAREVASLVSRWVREVDATRGPVFAARYHAHRIDSLTLLRHEVRMLAWRPVAMKLCARPSYYTKSSLRNTLGLGRARDFNAKPLLNLFDPAIREARMAIRDAVRGRPTRLELREWELNHGLALATGTDGNSAAIAREVRGTAATLVAAAGPEGIDGALGLLERWVAHRLGLSRTCLSTLPGADGARARALVAGLAVQAGLCTAAAVARRFKRAKATLCEQMSASRSRLADQAILAVPVDQIVREVLALPPQGGCRGAG